MALINCFECGKKVSERAVFCPKCGFPISEEIKRIRRQEYEKERRKRLKEELENNSDNEVKDDYNFEYLDEYKFRKLERALKKYSMLAYKRLVFETYPKLRRGDFIGKLIKSNNEDNTKKYEFELSTDDSFKSLHGNIVLYYSVDENNCLIILETISPESILFEGHRQELETYKGVMISKPNYSKDIFKINLLNMLKNDK